MYRVIFILFFFTCLHTTAQDQVFKFDSVAIENAEFKSPFPKALIDTLGYKEYSSDSLRIKISFTDTLSCMETKYQENAVLTIGIKDVRINTDRTTMGVLNTNKTGTPVEALVGDLSEITAVNPANITNFDFGKQAIDGQEAAWFKLTSPIENNQFYTTLVYYVVHPGNKKLYLIYVSTFAGENFNEKILPYYGFIKTIKLGD